MSFFNGIEHLEIKNGSFSVTRNVVYLKGDFDDLSPHSDDKAAFHDSHLPKYLQITEGSFRVVRFIRRRGSSRLFYEGPDIPITNSGEDPATRESAIKRVLAYLISGVKHVDISGGTFALQTIKTLASPHRGPFYAPQKSTVHKHKFKFFPEPKNIHIHGASFVESTILIDSSDTFDKDRYGEFTNVVGLVNDTKIGFKGIPENYLPGLSLFPGCRKMEISGGDFSVTLTDLVFLDDEDQSEPLAGNSLPQSRFPPVFNNGASQATPVTQTTINMNNIVNQQSIIIAGDNYNGNIEKSVVGGKGNSSQVTNNRGLGQENNHNDDPHEGYARERKDGNDQHYGGESEGGNNQGYAHERQDDDGAHGQDDARERDNDNDARERDNDDDQDKACELEDDKDEEDAYELEDDDGQNDGRERQDNDGQDDAHERQDDDGQDERQDGDNQNDARERDDADGCEDKLEDDDDEEDAYELEDHDELEDA